MRSIVVIGSTVERALELPCPYFLLNFTVGATVGDNPDLHHALADELHRVFGDRPSRFPRPHPSCDRNRSPRHTRGLMRAVVT